MLFDLASLLSPSSGETPTPFQTKRPPTSEGIVQDGIKILEIREAPIGKDSGRWVNEICQEKMNYLYP